MIMIKTLSVFYTAAIHVAHFNSQLFQQLTVE